MSGMLIPGGVVVIRPGNRSAVSQSGAALLELSRPECGTVVGTSSAGCEVCREIPCRNESSDLGENRTAPPRSRFEGAT